eukprot:42689-Eustigmatos_ZCMA.PRE.1
MTLSLGVTLASCVRQFKADIDGLKARLEQKVRGGQTVELIGGRADVADSAGRTNSRKGRED